MTKPLSETGPSRWKLPSVLYTIHPHFLCLTWTRNSNIPLSTDEVPDPHPLLDLQNKLDGDIWLIIVQSDPKKLIKANLCAWFYASRSPVPAQTQTEGWEGRAGSPQVQTRLGLESVFRHWGVHWTWSGAGGPGEHRQFYKPQNTNWLKVSAKIDSFFHLTLLAPLRRRHGKRQYQVYSFRRGCRNHLRYRWQDGKHPCNEDPGPWRAGTVHFNSPGGGQAHQQAFRTSFRVHCESSGHQR